MLERHAEGLVAPNGVLAAGQLGVAGMGGVASQDILFAANYYGLCHPDVKSVLMGGINDVE